MAEHEPVEARIALVYYSRFGVVRALAEAIGEGARAVPRVTVEHVALDDTPIGEPREGESTADAGRRRAAVVNRLAAADAIVLGSPSYFGSMASAVKRFFEDVATSSTPLTADKTRPWRNHLFHGKIAAAFAASGTPHGGNEETLQSLLILAMHMGMVLVTPGQRLPILEAEDAPYGATAVSGPDGNRPPGETELQAARAMGQRVAEIAVQMHLGRSEWESRLRAVRKQQASTQTNDPSA
ncbi:MAG: NAD(P)H-dependent oxidoreductase [Chloroflexota bacterium]